MKKRKALRITAVVLVILLLAVAGYAGDYYRADEAAVEAMAGNDTVTVTTSGNLTVFASKEPETGLIFYPGGKVEHTAYAPLLMELAREDILCVLVKMPLNLAVLNVNAAEDIPERFPEIENWYIGGHSLGGSMAASYTEKHGSEVEGLILLAAYSTADLTGTDLEVLSLYGSEDRVLNMEKYQQYLPNLPENTAQQVIPGGNHGQFGSYGPQEGDGTASISGEAQLAFTLDSLLEFMHH